MNPALGWQWLGTAGQEAQGSLLRRLGGEEGEGEIPRAKRVCLGEEGSAPLWWRRRRQQGRQDLGQQGHGLPSSILCQAPLEVFLVQWVQSCHTPHSFPIHSAFFLLFFFHSEILLEP